MKSELLNETARRSIDYLESLANRSVAPRPHAVSLLRESLARAMPQGTSGALEVLRELDRLGSPATMASAGPRFFGFVNGGALPAALAANWLAGAWDQNSFSAASSPAGVLFEDTALRWLRSLFGFPDDAAGVFTTGATMANFAALAAARHRLLANAGWDVESQGLFGAPPIRVVLSEQSHPTIRKSLGMLGMGRDRVTTIPNDDQGRIRADAIPQLDALTLVCAQAGNVNSGAFDPFPALVAACRDSNAWLHVDGAFGLWALASKEKQALAQGIEGADSWVTDGHKWLNVPYDCGVVFVRDSAALRSSMSISAAYLPTNESVGAPSEPFLFSPESSRRARGVDVWAALRSLGRDGVEQLVDRCCRHALRFGEALSSAGYEVLNEVVLNQVVVSFGDDQRNQAAIAAIQNDGICWCGPTHWRGRSAMRISVSCWATEDEDVERSLESIFRCVAPS